MDPVDRLIADEWQASGRTRPRLLALVDAPALLEDAVRCADEVVVVCDDLRDLVGVPERMRVDPTASGFHDRLDGVDAVWMRLPRAVDELAAMATRLAAVADPGVRVVAGGRVKHMTLAMNDALGQGFSDVHASLGRQKSRVLHASGPRHVTPVVPRRLHHSGAGLGPNGLDLVGWPGVFAGSRIDRGTALMLTHLDEVPRGRVHDLGTGSGVLAAALARDAGRRVSASDVSAAAVASARATADANGLPVEVSWADGLRDLPDHSLDAVVTNPPFHREGAKDSAPTLAMFADAARVLRPGGEFWCVFNSHLPWRSHLRRLVGPTRVVAQDRHYTLTRSAAA